MMTNGPQSSFKQPRSRRKRASVSRASEAAQTLALTTNDERTAAGDLQRGDVFEFGGDRLVLIDKEAVGYGLIAITYRRVRRDGSIVTSGEPITTSMPRAESVRVRNHISGDLIGSQRERNTMAKTVTRTAGKSKSGKGKVASKEATTRTRRTAEEVDALVDDFVKHLQDGGTMKELKAEYGFSDDGPIRAALYRNGYDSKGNEHEDEEDIDASKAAGKKALLKLRQEGAAWFVLAFRAGITEAEAKKIIEEQGGPTGRVYPPKAEKPAKAGKAKKALTPAQKRKAAKEAEEDPS